MERLKYKGYAKINGVLQPIKNVGMQQFGNKFDKVKNYTKQLGGIFPLWEIVGGDGTDDGTVLFTVDNKIVRVNPSTGETLWERVYDSPSPQFSVLPNREAIHVKSYEGKLELLDYNTGDVLYYDESITLPAWVTFDSAGICYTWDSPIVRAYKKGQLLWETSGAIMTLDAGEFIADNGMLFLGNSSELACIDTTAQDYKWFISRNRYATSSKTGHGVSTIDELGNAYSMNAEESGDTASMLVCYSALDGETLWSKSRPRGTISLGFYANGLSYPQFFTDLDTNFSYVLQHSSTDMANRQVHVEKMNKIPGGTKAWEITLPNQKGKGFYYPFFDTDTGQLLVSHTPDSPSKAPQITSIDMETSDTLWESLLGVKVIHAQKKSEGVYYLITLIGAETEAKYGLYELDMATGDFNIISTDFFPSILTPYTTLSSSSLKYTPKVFFHPASEPGYVYIHEKNTTAILKGLSKINLANGEVIWRVEGDMRNLTLN